jgi:hypothetical protein
MIRIPLAGKGAVVACCFLLLLFRAKAQEYNRYFLDKTLRIDLNHTGSKTSETLALDRLSDEGPWPGSRFNLLDTLNLGEYQVRVFDAGSDALIYSRGYSTMFNEWQTTDEATPEFYRTFQETIRIPYPKQPVQVTVHRRDKKMAFREIYAARIDPNSPAAVHREHRSAQFRSFTLQENGPASKKVDLLILGDGYRKEDMEKFRADAKHFNELMFSTQPFKSRRTDFNVRAIEVASQDSGIDKPDLNVWKATALGTTYSTFGVARYVLTDENRAMRDIAGSVPYDFIIILFNDNRYGGGGIYNLYSTCYARSDHEGMDWQMDYVYVHEFGHSFGGLADEYYSSQVAYNDFYQKGIEPWEPNITALSGAGVAKWRGFLTQGTPIPTPWGKEQYDSLERLRGKLDRLASDYYEKRAPLYRAERELLKNSPEAGKVGAFEGAGYVSEGMYRPAIDCRMFSLSLTDFDPVCSAAINRMIDFYSH